MRAVALLLLLLVLTQSVAAFWMSLPSANNGSSSCGSWITDKFIWDDEDDNNGNLWSGVIPRGNYDKSIEQYFCTGNVDSIPLGSYCFPQNGQNCIPFF